MGGDFIPEALLLGDTVPPILPCTLHDPTCTSHDSTSPLIIILTSWKGYSYYGCRYNCIVNRHAISSAAAARARWFRKLCARYTHQCVHALCVRGERWRSYIHVLECIRLAIRNSSGVSMAALHRCDALREPAKIERHLQRHFYCTHFT